MQEFDIVELTQEVKSSLNQEIIFEVGTRGIIVFIHAGEQDFEVELFDKQTRQTVGVETIHISKLKKIN